MATVSLLFGSLAHFYEKPVVVIATACAGSFAVLYGKQRKQNSCAKEFLRFHFHLTPFYLRQISFHEHKSSEVSFAFSGADYFLRTSFSVTIEAFLLRIRDVVWDGLRSELSNWTYRAKVPDHLAVRFTKNCEYQEALIRSFTLYFDNV